MKKEKMTVEKEIKDVIDAKDTALDYLANGGIVVFTYEIVAIAKRRLSWLVEIDGKSFTGIVLIESRTGKVLTAIIL